MSTTRSRALSKQTSQKPSPASSYSKFLLRTIRITDHTEIVFRQVCIKRVYLKNLYDERERDNGNLETPYRPFKSNRVLKTLKNIKISSLSRSYANESFKYSKRIKTFKFNTYSNEAQISQIPNRINRLPTTVQCIHLSVVSTGIKTDPLMLYKIAHSIRKLPNLQYFQRDCLIDTENKENHVAGELIEYHDSAFRLKKLKRMVYSLGADEQKYFQSLMRINEKFEGINALKLYLTSEELRDFERNEDFFEHDDSQEINNNSFDSENWTPEERHLNQQLLNTLYKDGEEHNPNVTPLIPDLTDKEAAERERAKIPHDFLMKFLIREDMRPFYRYQNFPNLKKLGIIQEDSMYPLGSFVVNGFAQLKKLEEFKLDIMGRSPGSTFLFKGFLQFPLLRKFALHITFIKNEDWALLEQFMKTQVKLESFSLAIRHSTSTKDRYLAQNASLGNILRDLQNKPKLRSLSLRSAFWPLETISKALGQLTLKNQLEEFVIEASDETITSQEKLWKRVEGLCNFIKNHKGSLKKLFVFIPCVVEDNIVTHVAEAISKLTNLRELFFSVNSGGFEDTESLMIYFERTLQHGIPKKERKKMAISKTWNPCVAKYFKRLDSLEELAFCFNRLDLTGQKEENRWFLDVMKVPPGLERLRKVWINCNAGDEFWDIEEKVSSAVLELRNVRVVNVTVFDRVNFHAPYYPTLKRAVKTVSQRQSMRCDLMF